MGEDRDGMVFIFFLHHVHHNNIYHAEEFRIFNKLIETIPPKFSAVHLCCPEGRMYDVAKAAVTLLIGKENRERLRLHVGSYQECKYALQSFGIPVGRLPINLEPKGKSSKKKQFDTKYHKKWLSIRDAKEAAIFAAIGRHNHGRRMNENTDDIGGSFKGVMTAVREIRSKFVECPRHEDCLFGKGRPTMYHPGNIAMRKLLEERIDRFEALMPLQKSIVVWEVVNKIKRGTGRFLKEDTDHAGVFVITDDEIAFKKIAIAFRDLKKRRLREVERRDANGNLIGKSSKEDKEKNNQTTSTVRGRKRRAISAAESSTIASVEFDPPLSILGVSMSIVMDMNDEVQCCPSLPTEGGKDEFSKQRKRLQNDDANESASRTT